MAGDTEPPPETELLRRARAGDEGATGQRASARPFQGSDAVILKDKNDEPDDDVVASD